MAYYPKVGDKKTFVPEALKAGLISGIERSVTGTIIWIHPARRFYLVRVEVGEHVWHEAFLMNE